MVMRVADKDFMLNFSDLEENENNAKVDTKKMAQMIIIFQLLKKKLPDRIYFHFGLNFKLICCNAENS